DQTCSAQSVLVRLRIVSLHVERLGAVGKRVQRRADSRLTGKRQRELRLVDGAAEASARAAAAHLALVVADAEVGRPLRARIGRRYRDDRDVCLGGDRLAEVDRAPAAERDDTVSGLCGRLGDELGWNLRP